MAISVEKNAPAPLEKEGELNVLHHHIPGCIYCAIVLEDELPDTIVFLGYIYLPYLFGINTVAVDFY